MVSLLLNSLLWHCGIERVCNTPFARNHHGESSPRGPVDPLMHRTYLGRHVVTVVTSLTNLAVRLWTAKVRELD